MACLVFTVDHKKIGIMYGVVAMFWFLWGGVEALLIRAQLFTPNGTVLTAEQYNQIFTMHGTTMVFLVIMPLAAAFANYIVPLQIGARDVAFPRMNALGLWVFVFGGFSLISAGSWAVDQMVVGSPTPQIRASRSARALAWTFMPLDCR